MASSADEVLQEEIREYKVSQYTCDVTTSRIEMASSADEVLQEEIREYKVSQCTCDVTKSYRRR